VVIESLMRLQAKEGYTTLDSFGDLEPQGVEIQMYF
jgi:hypothetical protein